MNSTHDVVVIGGAFSGAATALLLKRERPELRVAVVERSREFDRKVGEATTEVSGNFLTKHLCLTAHLNNHHIVKQGLRFWFTSPGVEDFGRCGELGAFYQTHLPGYQVDRAVLDQHVLDLAQAAGAGVLRPARVVSIELRDVSVVMVEGEAGRRELRARWIIDASGRATVLARKLGLLRPLPEHPTNSVWARFRGVKDFDGPDLRRRYPDYARACQAGRTAATNHLTGYGWWVWIIPLKGGDTSVGIVYDERIFELPAGPSLGERLHAHLLTNPVGREIFAAAEPISGDVKAYSSLPYFSEKIAGPGWQIVGDAVGFLAPLYSAGIDFCSFTISAAVARILEEGEGKAGDCRDINARFSRSYHGWFNALNRDKYYYLGDSELMTAAFLMDLGLFFFGPVRELLICPKGGFSRFPFDGPVDGAVSRFMAFYNRRLAALGRKRMEAGVYGARNPDRRTMIRGFEPTPKVLRLVARGIGLWLRAEGRSIFLRKPAIIKEREGT